jgi:hypothetical protein
VLVKGVSVVVFTLEALHEANNKGGQARRAANQFGLVSLADALASGLLEAPAIMVSVEVIGSVAPDRSALQA